jgi:hypothetical protein
MSDPLADNPLGREARIRAIAERVEFPVRGQLVFLEGGYRELPVARVPHQALLYRFDNGRVAAELEEHVVRVGSSLESLRAAQETAEVQHLLQGMLLSKATDRNGPIFAELERLGQQTEPLLVLFDGVVVNGNRRLAAMRELIRRDPRRYRSFAEVAVTVLPEATRAEEVEYVEAALQMAPETKLGYGWLDRRLKLRRQRDVLGLPVAQIMAAYRIEDAAEIRRELGELALAEEYLASYLSEPYRYSEVADAGPLFVGLYHQLTRLAEPDRSFWRLAGFAMIHGRARRKQNEPHRLYPFVDPVPAELPVSGQARIAERLAPGADRDVGGGRLSPAVLDQTVSVLRDPRRSAATARAIAAALDELRLEHEERSAPERVLRKVRETGSLIARLTPDRLSPDQRTRLRGDLAALQAHATFLLGRMAQTGRVEQTHQPEHKPAVPLAWHYPKTILRPPYAKGAVAYPAPARLGRASARSARLIQFGHQSIRLMGSA